MKSTRWEQRLDNFERALTLLKSALSEKSLANMSDLEKEGVIQRFEYTFELAWKTVKDFLLYQGVVLDQTTPRSVIKQAFSDGVIKEGQIWIDMLDNRNLMSHTYNFERFKKAFLLVTEQYVQPLENVFEYLKHQSEKKQ